MMKFYAKRRKSFSQKPSPPGNHQSRKMPMDWGPDKRLLTVH